MQSFVWILFLLSYKLSSISENCLKKCRNKDLNDDLEVIQCQTSCMFQQGIEKAQYSELLQDENLYELPDNYCLNNIEANTYKQKLAFFNQGPCQPLVLLPGIFSTKLIVEIDCEELRKNDPQLFEQCGWTDCEKEFYEIWKKVPNDEYKLWINDFTSPMNFFGSFQENLCFSNIFKTKYDFNKPYDQWIQEKKGVRIRASGFTKNTSSFSKCGADSIQNLLPTPLQLPQTIAFGKLIRQLERIGYVSGLTYQTIPYNFYYSIFQNEGSINLKNQIKRLYDLNGKQVTLIAHSNGNMITLYTLAMNFSKKEKEKYIKNYIALAAPYLGAYQANRFLIGGNRDYIHAQDYIGFSWDASKIFLDNQASLYFFLMKNFKKLYEGEEWYEKIKQRLKYEQEDDIEYKDSGINFWPSKNDQCYRNNVQNFPQNCLLDFEDPNEDFMFIGHDKYSINNFIKALTKYNNEKIVLDLYERLGSVNLGKLNPGVPVFLVYQSVQNTDYKLFFSQSYKESISNNTYPTLDYIQSIRGDDSVNISSTLLPSLRWALKSDEGDTDYKKVTFIEMCSIHNQTIDYYDSVEDDGSKTFTKNRYIGLHCKCSEDDDYTYETCKHNSLISDDNFVKLALKLLDTNAIGDKKQFIKIQDMDEEELKLMVENCQHYEHDVYNYHEQKNYFHLRRDFCWYEKKKQLNFLCLIIQHYKVNKIRQNIQQSYQFILYIRFYGVKCNFYLLIFL